MRDTILALEQVARSLEPDTGIRQTLDAQVLQYAGVFIDKLPEAKGYEIEDTSQALASLSIGETGRELSELLQLLGATVDHSGINPASGGHLGYIPGGGIYPAALGDYLAAVTNRFAGIYFANPGAVRLEHRLIRWMLELVGYPDDAHGNLTSGGSIANLIAITTARDAMGIRSADIPQSVIYCHQQTHHCVDKAIRIAGLGESVLRHIALDSAYAMDAQRLAEQVKRDKADGLRPFLVIASLGSTDTGAVDPIGEIANICAAEGLWLQIDAAYGGFFQLLPELAHLFRGVDRSDSYILDPHKGLFLPYGTGAVLVRDGRQLHAAHAFHAHYLQDAQRTANVWEGIATDHTGLSPADLSPELTKHFRGLRMWLPLQLFGLAPFRAAIREKYLLAQYFFARISDEGFEVGPRPMLSVVIYRYNDGIADTNAFNKKLIDAIHRDGRIFISSTMIDGVFWLRLAVLCFRTHLRHVDLLIAMLVNERDRLIHE